jgi:3-phosphoshikimate 1-carboxyvinyltransferase
VFQRAGIRSWKVRGPLHVDGVLRPPGDKSIAHRALLFAALSRGTCRLSELPDGDDVARTAAALVALGVRLARGGSAWVVHGAGLRGLHPAAGPVDCGNSGTTMRLLCGLLAPQHFETVLVGDASLMRRPMARVAAPLQAMGAQVTFLGRDGRPPLRVGGGTQPLAGMAHRMSTDSAQVRSALWLAALVAAGPTTIAPRGASRDHTERALAACGIELQVRGDAQVLFPSCTEGWAGFDQRIPGDLSSAAFAIALAAALPGARLRVEAVGLNPGRARYLEILRAAGARIVCDTEGASRGEPWGTVRVEGGALGAITLRGDDTVRCIDEVPALCAAAAIAAIPARIADAAELRTKESDRIAGIAALLAAFGARVSTSAGGLQLQGGARLRAATVTSHGDHRLAMAAAMLAAAARGTSRIDDVACVATSYPCFAADLQRLTTARPRVRGA